MPVKPYLDDALVQNNAEGGSNGTTVSTGNSGGASGDAFGSVQITGSSTVVFSSASPIHDSLSILATGVGGFAAFRWGSSILGTQSVLHGVMYVSWSAFPASSTPFMEIKQTDGGALAARLRITSTGGPRLTDSSDSTIFTGSNLSTGTVYRFEWTINTTGAYRVAWYLGDSASAIDTRTGSSAAFGTQLQEVTFGRTTSPDHTTKYDSIAVGLTQLGARRVAGSSAIAYAEPSNPGAWTVTGAASRLVALRDGSDASYAETPDGPQDAEVTYTLEPFSVTAPVTVTTRGSASNASATVTRTVTIKDGSTTLIADPFVLTTSVVAHNTTTPAPVTAGTELTVIISDDVP